MARAGTAFVQIKGDFGPLRAGLRSAESTYGRQLESMQSRLRKGFTVAAKVAGVALAAGAAVGAKRSVDAAVNLGEQINKTKVVFRGAEEGALSFGETSASAFGISNRAALEAAGTFGNMLVPMGLSRKEAAGMSVEMVRLGADMASFNNASPEETLHAIRSGLAGESEPLRRFGVDLREAALQEFALSKGIKESVKDMTNAEKAQLAYKKILVDTKDAQGDFARTSDSLANRQRQLKAQLEDIAASLGTALLPGLQKGAAALADFAGDVSDILNRDDLTAGEKFDRIGDEIAERIEAAVPVVTAAAAKIGPKIAEALVRGFIQAPALVQLVAGAWVFAKARKLLAAFGLLGKQAGASFAAGAATTAPAAVIPGAAAGAGGAAAGGAAAGAAGGAAAKAGGLAGLATKMKPLAKSAGFAAVGIVIADTILNALELQMDRRSPDLDKRLKGLSKTPEISLLNDIPGLGPLAAGAEALGLEDRSAKQAQRLKVILNQVATSHQGITAAAAAEGTKLAENLDLTQQQRDETEKLLAAGRQKAPLPVSAKGAITDFTKGLASGKRDVSRVVTDLLSGLDGLDVSAQRKASRFALGWAKGLHETGALSRREFRTIKSIIDTNVGEIGGVSMAGPRKLLRSMGLTFDQMVSAVQHPTSQMGRIVADALEALGEGQKASNIRTRVVAEGLQRSGKGQGAKMIRRPRARGGFIGRPGERGRDEEPLDLPPKWAVSNHHQESVFEFARKVAPRLRAAAGGLVPVMAARGERVYDDEEIRRTDRDLAVTSRAGLQPHRSMREVFSRITKPHHLASGGFVSRRRHEEEHEVALPIFVGRDAHRPGVGIGSQSLGKEARHSHPSLADAKFVPLVPTLPTTFYDKTAKGSPAGRIREGLGRLTIGQVEASFARGGFAPRRPGKAGAQGIVPIPGQPGESIHQSILSDVEALIKRYKLKVTDGYAPSGHAAGGEHPKGLAIDAVPGAGGSWDLVDKLAKWAEPKQGSPRSPFRWVGYTGDSGHGRGNHLHLSWGGGGGGGVGIDMPELPDFKVTGRNTAMKNLAEAGVKQVRRAAQKFLDKQVGDGGAPVGTSSDPGGGAAANKRLAKTLMRGVFPASEFPALSTLWQGESGWDEKAVNPSSGAGGIPQALPASKMGEGWQGNARQQIAWGLKYIKERYGSPSAALSAWQGRSPHWYAQGGIVEDVQHMYAGGQPIPRVQAAKDDKKPSSFQFSKRPKGLKKPPKRVTDFIKKRLVGKKRGGKKRRGDGFDLKQLDFWDKAIDKTIPTIQDRIGNIETSFDLAEPEHYPDERTIARLRGEGHNVEEVFGIPRKPKDKPESYIDWTGVEQSRGFLSQILGESFRLIGTPFGAPNRGVMEILRDAVEPIQVSIKGIIDRLNDEANQIRAKVRENLRKLRKNEKRVETLDARIDKEKGRKKPDKDKLKEWRDEKSNLGEDDKALRKENRRLTGASDPGGDLSGIEKGRLGEVQVRHKAAEDALVDFQVDRVALIGESGTGGDYASTKNEIAQRVKAMGEISTERIREAVAPIPSEDAATDAAQDVRSYLASLFDLRKQFGSNFKQLPGFQRGGIIPGTGTGDRVLAALEPGEGLINKTAVMQMGGPAAIERINQLMPRFQTGGVVASPIQVMAPRGQQQMVVVKQDEARTERPNVTQHLHFSTPPEDQHTVQRAALWELQASV